jgi:hypothetical protein
VPLAYPVLAYLAARALWAGVRPRARSGPLVPIVPAAVLALGLVFLLSFRVVHNVVDGNVIDVGYAGVIGADRAVDGDALYEGDFAVDIQHGDTYGPLAYLAYVPFEQLLPWSGRWDELPAAHAAAIAFDLATVLVVFLLGRRLRSGRQGRLLGLALAYGWAAYPYSAFVLASNSNDSMVGLLLALALLALASAPARGALVALASLVKLAPLALVPLFAGGTGERRGRSFVAFGAVFGALVMVAVAPFVPDGGVPELYGRTLGNQIGRESPFSLWGQYPGLAPVQLALAAATVALVVAVAFVPRRRSPAQVAALGAGVLLLLQLAAAQWFYLYVVWFLPLLLVALFAEHVGASERSGPAAEAAQGSAISSGSIEVARPSSSASTTTAFSQTSSSAVSSLTGI